MSVTSFDPRTGQANSEVTDTTSVEYETILATAAQAAVPLSRTPPTLRRSWASEVSAALLEAADELVSLADRETGLGTARLRSELDRCAANWLFYADVAVEGSFLDATIDHATDTSPAISKADMPVGPVAVFGASNFPFGFGVAGHDAASALAAGCPVVVKAHPAHPLLSERLGWLVRDALARAGAVDGAFAIVAGFEHGAALVLDDRIAAVAFTGSQTAGMHLQELARTRRQPIPVYAEMGTVNPVVVLPSAVSELESIARGFVDSFTLGSGQFCTKPGLMLSPRGSHAVESVTAALERSAPDPIMLTEQIARSVEAGLGTFEAVGATVHRVGGGTQGWRAPAAVITAPAASVVADSPFVAEVFGAVALVIEYDSRDELGAVLARLQDSLAASVFADPHSTAELSDMVDLLSRRVGRVIVNGWPTGVACVWSQHHGGGWPSTTDARATSVGGRALTRFVRPVAFQGAPDSALPDPLRADNPWGIPRRIDGIVSHA